ncbi:hypothetical protein ABT297_22235 [Dactylosporangium sp. NPDC000555]
MALDSSAEEARSATPADDQHATAARLAELVRARPKPLAFIGRDPPR